MQTYATIFTQEDTDDNDSAIILANGITIDELNKEKTVDKVVIRNKILNKISINPRDYRIGRISCIRPFTLFGILGSSLILCNSSYVRPSESDCLKVMI